jgi:hypothetical protein
MFPVFRFPQPTRPDAIGTLTYHWVDAARPEVFTADPHDRRELMVQLWYPAKGDPAAPRAPYIQDADAVASALARLRKLPASTLGHLQDVTNNAVPSAQPNYRRTLTFLWFRCCNCCHPLISNAPTAPLTNSASNSISLMQPPQNPCPPRQNDLESVRTCSV